MLKDKKRTPALETANPLDTSEVTTTQNPQGGSANPSASDAADFQQTAPSEALNQDAENLSVTSTGEPNDTPTSVATNSSNWFWGGAVIAVVIIAIYVIAKILREEAEDDEVESAPVSAPVVKKTATKKTSKKKPAKKKTTRKKTSKRR